ncbi:MAG: protein-glutamate O-methyltransferase CheR [Actinobacteria bacterium]|nr:protein-glutamate O-methyltransferase CheR [Actinomycetota bacterium]MCA1720105.1 protein-glutamate O-methyltransferase CheR [Actinomycetota bacterium]
MSLSPDDYGFVRQLVAQESALALGENKAYLVEARLARIAEREGCASVAELIGRLRTGTVALRDDVVQAMTTNETSFFRDVHPFEALRDVVLPQVLAARGRASVWSAAASTGQEAYSIAMLAADSFPGAPISVLATDLSRDVLARAEAGVFSQLETNRGLPAAALVRHFERAGAGWRVRDPIRARVQFRQLNLARPWPLLPSMDVVLLRNVLIYFDADAKRAVLAQAARILAPGGVLFLGGAETTYGLDETWERVQVGRTSFYRPARVEGGR